MELKLDHKTIIADGESTEFKNPWIAIREIRALAILLNGGIWINIDRDEDGKTHETTMDEKTK